jgi:hypothetical protein
MVRHATQIEIGHESQEGVAVIITIGTYAKFHDVITVMWSVNKCRLTPRPRKTTTRLHTRDEK